MTTAEPTRRSAAVGIDSPASGVLRFSLAGDWLLDRERPRADQALSRLDTAPSPARIEYHTGALGEWDTGLVHYLARLEGRARELGITVAHDGLPEGAARLIRMAFAVAPPGDRPEPAPANLVQRLGKWAVARWDQARSSLAFLGEFVLSLGRLSTGRATYQRSDLWVTMQEVSAEALGIVSLISFLVGAILAFIGANEFEKLGAGIYTANLVGLAMLRELGPIMVGIIMAGRTGAAFAAQIGTMKVNEEIDALRTLGINPIDYLVLPRALALILMMPLLTLYGDLLGLVGGTAVSVAFLDVTPSLFLGQLQSSVGLNDLFAGLIMSAVFGVLVALAGCQRGIECGNSAQAVGAATTSAVVTGIVAIISSCAVLNFVYTVLGV